MSLAEMAPPEEAFDKTPPQDVAAEQSVLGGMLMSKDAIADVLEVVRGTDFYRPAHEAVYEAILDLYGRGEPADAVTVSAELTKRGELGRIGGAPYLHTLLSSVPTAANAGYYARIVRERAVLRRLVDAGTRIVQLGYATDGGDVDDLVNSAQAEVYAVTERRTSEDYVPLKDIINSTMEEIDAASHHGEGMVGVPTGFVDFDALTNGLHPGQMVVVAARPAMGKALALHTPLPTPSGWTTMGQVQVGDELIAADGSPTRVVAATEVMTGRPCYEVTFDDGTTVIADAEHQWLTEAHPAGVAEQPEGESLDAGPARSVAAQIRTTEQIAHTMIGDPSRRLDHWVGTTAAVQYRPAEMPLDPYLLGVWLAGGHAAAARYSAADPEIAMHIEARGYLVDSHPASSGAGTRNYSIRLPATAHGPAEDVAAQLLAVGVLGDKHIPEAYLRASIAQRQDLLAGLLDAGGIVSATGAVQVTVASDRLAGQVRELLHTLGYRSTGGAHQVARGGRTPSSVFTLTFSTEDAVFTLASKQLAHKERAYGQGSRHAGRYITAVRAVAPVPVRCVEVDNPEHLYLASHSFIPTHNSTLGLDFARAASIKNGMTSVIFSLEMSRNEISMRMLSAESQVPLNNMRKGTMRDEDWTRLARTMSRVSDAPLFIDDSPNMSLMEIRAKCRRLKQRHDLKLVVIDYLQLMSSGKRVESRQQEVSEFSRALKLLAKELEVPVIAISQLNRGAEQRTDKRPQMSDLRESGSIEQDADVVILLHRDDMYEKESPRAGEADMIVAKHRNGPTDTIVLAFQGHYTRFVDMAQ